MEKCKTWLNSYIKIAVVSLHEKSNPLFQLMSLPVRNAVKWHHFAVTTFVFYDWETEEQVEDIISTEMTKELSQRKRKCGCKHDMMVWGVTVFTWLWWQHFHFALRKSSSGHSSSWPNGWVFTTLVCSVDGGLPVHSEGRSCHGHELKKRTYNRFSKVVWSK